MPWQILDGTWHAGHSCEISCEIAHVQAKYLGLLKEDEIAWEVKNWEERIREFSGNKFIKSAQIMPNLNFKKEEISMKTEVNLDAAYIPSEDIVAREIEGELIIVPLVSGIGNMEDELFTLNETGKAIWNKLDSQKSLKVLVEELSTEFEDPGSEIEKDVIGLVGELLKRRMVVAVSGG